MILVTIYQIKNPVMYENDSKVPKYNMHEITVMYQNHLH